MLTFTYKLKNFGVAATTHQNNGGGFGGGNRGGFGRPCWRRWRTKFLSNFSPDIK
ncbi:MAG: hypothetical protein WDM90_15665 [Ferruginibacter sp.]